MSDPFPDPPTADVTWATVGAGHVLIYLGHTVDPPLDAAGNSTIMNLTMDWEPASGNSRVWATDVQPAIDPLSDLRVTRTFATIRGNMQTLYLAQVSDANAMLSQPLVMGFEPGPEHVRLWLLDRALAGGTRNVDYLVPKLNDSTFSTIGSGHQLVYLDHDSVLDWEPNSAGSHARVWRLDRSRTAPFPNNSTKDPLPTKLAENTFSTITDDHELTYLSGDTLLDRERSTNRLRVWQYDRTATNGDFLPGAALHDATPTPVRFAADEQLVYLGADQVLAFQPSTGRARVFEYDRIATENPRTLALNDVATNALPWVNAARAALVGPPSPAIDALLQRHFRYTTATGGASAALVQIRSTFDNLATALVSMSHVTAVTKKEFIAFAGTYNAAATFSQSQLNAGTRLSPEYRRYGWTGNFFEGRGDELRAAIMIHEGVHFVDPSGNDAAEEWRPTYDTIPADQAIHNPSTYAVFARNVATGAELLFGQQPWR